MKRTKKANVARPSSRRIARESAAAASGALAGSVAGAGGGPAGAAAGALLGAVAGAMAGAVMDQEGSRQSARTRELDRAIGVIDGDLGAPCLPHPPANVGTYSGASVGEAPSCDETPAEGPIPAPEH